MYKEIYELKSTVVNNYIICFCKRVLRFLYKNRNMKRYFKSCKASDVFWVDRVVSVIWVMLSTFHISVLEWWFH